MVHKNVHILFIAIAWNSLKNCSEMSNSSKSIYWRWFKDYSLNHQVFYCILPSWWDLVVRALSISWKHFKIMSIVETSLRPRVRAPSSPVVLQGLVTTCSCCFRIHFTEIFTWPGATGGVSCLCTRGGFKLAGIAAVTELGVEAAYIVKKKMDLWKTYCCEVLPIYKFEKLNLRWYLRLPYYSINCHINKVSSWFLIFIGLVIHVGLHSAI